jgi:hypothetical protein
VLLELHPEYRGKNLLLPLPDAGGGARGLARLLGLMLTGVPSLAMLGGLFMELVVTPALCLWQTRVANRYAEREGIAAIPADEPA